MTQLRGHYTGPSHLQLQSLLLFLRRDKVTTGAGNECTVGKESAVAWTPGERDSGGLQASALLGA